MSLLIRICFIDFLAGIAVNITTKATEFYTKATMLRELRVLPCALRG